MIEWLAIVEFSEALQVIKFWYWITLNWLIRIKSTVQVIYWLSASNSWVIIILLQQMCKLASWEHMYQVWCNTWLVPTFMYIKVQSSGQHWRTVIETQIIRLGSGLQWPIARVYMWSWTTWKASEKRNTALTYIGMSLVVRAVAFWSSPLASASFKASY